MTFFAKKICFFLDVFGKMAKLCGNRANFGKHNYFTIFFHIFAAFFDVERNKIVTKSAILEKLMRKLTISAFGPKNTGILEKGAKNQITKTKNTFFMIT